MARYLISFDDGSMDYIPDEFQEEVGAAAHAVVKEAQEAGVWIFGGGLADQAASVVAMDGKVTEGPFPATKAIVGGFSIVDVDSHEEALKWGAKIAVACRCAQDVRLIMNDPLV